MEVIIEVLVPILSQVAREGGWQLQLQLTRQEHMTRHFEILAPQVQVAHGSKYILIDRKYIFQLNLLNNYILTESYPSRMKIIFSNESC